MIAYGGLQQKRLSYGDRNLNNGWEGIDYKGI